MKRIRIGTCRICGSQYSTFMVKSWSPIWKKMIQDDVCSTCASWLIRETDPDAVEEVINGSVYRVYPFQYEKSEGDILGSGGRTLYIQKLDSLATYRSNDVWEIGKPPPAFRMPDTAVFTNKRVYCACKDGPFVCRGRACLDRYTCMMYFREKTEPDGPVNRIPKDWVDGGERCRYYLREEEMNELVRKWRERQRQ